MSAYVLLLKISTLLAVVAEGSYSNGKIGCLLAPSICTPPEDYCSDDGLIGNCQVPESNKEWRVENQLPYMKIIRDLETRGNIIDYRAIQDALRYRQYYLDHPDQKLVADQVYPDIQTLSELLSQLEYDYRTYGQDTSSDMPNEDHNIFKVEEDTSRDHQEVRRSTHQSKPDSVNFDADRKKQMRELVNESISIIRKDFNMEISDLSDETINRLARILAKDLARKEKVKKSMSSDEAKLVAEEESPHADRSFIKANNDQDLSITNDDTSGSHEKSGKAEEELKSLIVEEKADSKEYEFKIAQPQQKSKEEKTKTLYIVIIAVGTTVLLIVAVTVLTCCVRSYWKREEEKLQKGISVPSEPPLGEDYQELCRQHYASKNSEHVINQRDVVLDSPTKEPLITRTYPLMKPGLSDNASVDSSTGLRSELLGRQSATRNSSISSTSWSEEPVTASLDITTGHAVLSYMEDHLKNKDRLDKEWEDICSYEADRTATMAATSPQNTRKNRSGAALPYDHNRIKLKPDANHLQSDYVNASAIIDNDPKRPLYIATQGPLPSTIPDFWQMMWEQGCVAIVMLTPLVEEGVNQCARYWPDEGSCTYHKFEIHLVSEHIWCEDYLVRSLYLKNLETGDTRTVTQFHFLSWPNGRIPSTPKPLLELRRKVTKCYKGHNSPVVVHCSDGVGRTGTYILLDLAIDRMLKGAKEIDIAATLEHIRDQRSGMVATKEQFEFALTAVAEEVNAILKSLLQ